MKEQFATLEVEFPLPDASYCLPDGKIIQLGDERVKCGEILFEVGRIHEAVENVINKADKVWEQFLIYSLREGKSVSESYAVIRDRLKFYIFKYIF